MQLKEIYQPIEKELIDVEKTLRDSLGRTSYKSISPICGYLLDGIGKRLRPALVLLSAKATCKSKTTDPLLIKIASVIELIHMASLIHDDVIDHACSRHNKPTINSKWNGEVSIALGDYLYSVAYELISHCGNMDILQCISSATKAMCEGELVQVCERDNQDLLKERYIIVVQKKTASLFAASCQTGSLLSHSQNILQDSLASYGLNFGIGFQIMDDYLDIVSEEKALGKKPGQDIGVGEVTLPLLNLFESVPLEEKEELKNLLASKRDRVSLQRIKSRLLSSGAAQKTKEVILYYMNLAKENLGNLPDSAFKKSLADLTDFLR